MPRKVDTSEILSDYTLTKMTILVPNLKLLGCEHCKLQIKMWPEDFFFGIMPRKDYTPDIVILHHIAKMNILVQKL